MHVTGTLALNGESYGRRLREPARPFLVTGADRSWRGAVITPPIGWGGAYFDDTLAFNQFGIEPPDTNPAWKQLGLFENVPADGPFHHWAWLYTRGELREVPLVRRTVHAQEPLTFVPTRQDIELTDETGAKWLIHGEVVSMGEVYGWPNLVGHDGVYRSETEDGRVAHGPYQEVWQ